jgi:predicted nucleotidyltransferase
MPGVQSLLDRLVTRLKEVPGVAAVALGGSRARGTHTAASDIDLGLYYDPGGGLDLAALADAAAELDDQRRPDLMTPIGGWGPRINGGGWLQVEGTPVDLLYRDLAALAATISACQAHAFVSATHMAELALCQPLYDPHGQLAALKAHCTPYPAALRQALIAQLWWEAAFSLRVAEKGALRQDISYVAGCCYRAVACLLQTLFALNERYWMNEKGALALAATFASAPANLQPRVEAAFMGLRGDPAALHAVVAQLGVLIDEVDQLVRQQG